MSDTTEYTSLRTGAWNKENDDRFASINRPVAGATHLLCWRAAMDGGSDRRSCERAVL